MRILLALLAVLTGLVATAQPVAAKVCADRADALHGAGPAVCVGAVERTGDRAATGRPVADAPDASIADGVATAAPAAHGRAIILRCGRARE